MNPADDFRYQLSKIEQMKLQKKILVIEDDQNLGHTIQNILAINHYDVCYANNGVSGIQKAYEYLPDLVLCDVKMYPINGYQVYKILEESSILNHIPFIYISGSSEIDEIRFGMSLGADDYIVKPFNNDDLIRSIEKRLEKFQTISNEAKREFNRLFDLSPFGLFLFDGNRIFNANTAFLSRIQIDETVPQVIKIKDLFEPEQLKLLEENLQVHKPDQIELFNDHITLKTFKGEMIAVRLVVSEFEKYSNYTLYLGLIFDQSASVIPLVNHGYADEVNSLLQQEHIRISEALSEKITNIFKQKSLNLYNQNKTFYTKKENQVLCLVMEGLSIKAIADRLEISDRTVEKHRTRLMEKSGANNMIEVIIFALKNCLVQI